MRVLFIGDIVGSPGRHMVEDNLSRLIEEYQIDFTIANAENSAGGFGINRKVFMELYDLGIDAFTLGNHIWDNKDIYNLIDDKRLVRPVNLPPSMPGRGSRIFEVKGRELIVANAIGRVFMTPCDCPFRGMDSLLKDLPDLDDVAIVVDFHAEATSEKVAMGWFLDGRVSAVLGTHTHVQTADQRILPRGTAFITDAGMTGPRDSVLGVEKEIIVNRFLDGVSDRFHTANGDLQFNGIVLDISDNGCCREIIPINFWQPSL